MISKRKHFIKRKTCLKRVSTAVKKVSNKRSVQLKEYSKLRISYLTDNPICNIQLPHCTHDSTEVHHMKGKEGDLLLMVEYFKAACRSCHDWVTEHSNEAIELGFSVSRHKKEGFPPEETELIPEETKLMNE